MKKSQVFENTDKDDEEGGSQQGEIEFHDFLSTGETRELSREEEKRLLSVHADSHETRVKKQKELSERRELLKSGKISLSEYRQGKNQNVNSYRPNPVLMDKVQFSGIDHNETPIPTDSNIEANEEYRHRLVNVPELTARPRFNPTPTPR